MRPLIQTLLIHTGSRSSRPAFVSRSNLTCPPPHQLCFVWGSVSKKGVFFPCLFDQQKRPKNAKNVLASGKNTNGKTLFFENHNHNKTKKTHFKQTPAFWDIKLFAIFTKNTQWITSFFKRTRKTLTWKRVFLRVAKKPQT